MADFESMSGISSTDDEFIDETKLQRFREAKGPTIGREEFYLEVRKKRFKTARSLLGMGGEYFKFVKRQPEEFHKVKGYLLEKPYTEKIASEQGTFIPVELAEELLEPDAASRDDEAFKEAMKEILTPNTIHNYGLKGEINSWDDMDPSMQKPEGNMMEVFVNIPIAEVIKGPKKKGCLMMSTYNGRPIVVLPSGTVFSPMLNPTSLATGLSWKKMDIKEMTYEVGERIQSKADAMKEAENERLHRKVQDLEEKVRDLESRGVGTHDQPRPIVAEIAAAEEDEYAIYDLKDRAHDGKLIKERAKAVNLTVVTKSIPLWGKSSPHPAEDWLDMAIPRAKTVGVSMEVMHHVLLSRLDTDVSAEMYALESHGLLRNISDFIRVFKEKYMVLSTPVQKLRELQDARMTSAQVSQLRINEFGNGLLKKAHKAYEGLRLKRESWDTLDRVVVTMAFLNGIPRDIAGELVREGKTEMEEMIQLAAHLSRIGRDFAARSAVMMVTQENGGASNGQREGASGEKKTGRRGKRQWKQKNSTGDSMCQLCRESDRPPKEGACYHCRRCFKSGHGQKDCPQKEPTQLEEARKALRKKKE